MKQAALPMFLHFAEVTGVFHSSFAEAASQAPQYLLQSIKPAIPHSKL